MSELKLNEGQQRAYEKILAGSNMIICGCGGTGKSLLINKIRTEFGNNTLFLSTTGISAVSIGGVTLHSGMSIPVGHVTKEALKKVSHDVQKLFSTGAIKRIVIDEGSMITPSTWHGFVSRLARFSKKAKNRAATSFQVVIFADFLQLAAVMQPVDIKLAKEEYGTDRYFRMKSFEDMNFDFVELTQVMRQDDVEMKGMLSRIREAVPVSYQGNKPVFNQEVMEAIDYFNKRVIRPLPKDVPVLAATNKSVAEYNRLAFDRNYNPAGLFTASFTGNFKPADLPCDEKLYLKEGLDVIIVKNSPKDSDIKYVNGDLATVLSMSADGVYVRLKSNGSEVLIEPTRWEKHGYEVITHEDGTEELTQFVAGSATQIALKMSASISIHRSQGASMDKAIIDLGWGAGWAAGLVYVSLSRLRSIEGLYLTRKIRPDDIVVDKEALTWLNEMRAKSSH